MEAVKKLLLTFYSFIHGVNPVKSISLACLGLNEALVDVNWFGQHPAPSMCGPAASPGLTLSLAAGAAAPKPEPVTALFVSVRFSSSLNMAARFVSDRDTPYTHTHRHTHVYTSVMTRGGQS